MYVDSAHTGLLAGQSRLDSHCLHTSSMQNGRSGVQSSGDPHGIALGSGIQV
jgi:hypothetical protein